ncbi:MAG: PQQ-binding-like beta-propeller repeat protein [Pseudomonadota bacterium]
MRAWFVGIGAMALLAATTLVTETPASSQPATQPAAQPAVSGVRANVTQARVLSASDAKNNWLVYGGNFESQHFSPLDNISDKNVGSLGLAWSTDVDSPMGLALEPIVVDGVIYLGLPLDVVEAFDGVTGKMLWRFDPRIRINGAWRNSYEGRKNRGVAVWNGKVYVGTGDCRIVAINAATGTKVWDTTVCDAEQTGITEAPRVGNGLIYTGWAGMEYDVRGGVVALDAETGKKAWTFWTAPGDPSKPYETKTNAAIAKTWKGQSWQLAGANAWTALTYDPVTNLLFISTSTAGEAAGDFSNIKPSGNLLFANSIVAVNATTGDYVWHYQTAYPPDGAEDFHVLVADMKIGGSQRRVIMTKPRNGVFYTLDARTGKEALAPRGIGGTPYPSLKQVSLGTLESTGYHDAGPPKKLPETGFGGGWFPLSYNAQTGLVYISAYEVKRAPGGGSEGANGAGLEADGLAAELARQNIGGSAPGGKFRPYAPLPHGKLVAYDPIAQKPRWIATLPLELNGSPVSTAGNLVFQGDASGYFTAYAADTGRMLWSVKTGSAIQATPVTYAVNGEQYILMPVGLGGGYRLFGSPTSMSTLEDKRGPARLFAFKLGGKAIMPAIEPYVPAIPQPPQQTGTARQIATGAKVYNKFFCQKCHSPEADGSGAWALGGEVPDLRYMPRSVHKQFGEIVLGGTHREQGMPKFSVPIGQPLIKTFMTPAEAEALHAYVVDLQWRAYKLGPRGLKRVDGAPRGAPQTGAPKTEVRPAY